MYAVARAWRLRSNGKSRPNFATPPVSVTQISPGTECSIFRVPRARKRLVSE